MNPITQPLIMYVCSVCKLGWRAHEDAERCCKCRDCGGVARKNWTTCEACGRINSARRAAEILERRLATAITIHEAITMDVGEDEPMTWWRIEDRHSSALMEMLEQICDDAWDRDTQGLPADFRLPEVVEFVVGQRLTIDVRESFGELFQDDNELPEFDDEAIAFAQEAVDLAAETASYWGEGESYWVDIRPIRESVLREWLRDGDEVAI